MTNQFNIGNIAKKEEVKQTPPAPAEETTTEDKPEEMVPLSMLQGMMDEIKELKEGQKNLQEKKKDDEPESIPDNIVRLLEYNDKLVIAYNEKRGTWKKWDKDRREDKIFMEITTLNEKGEEKKEEIDYHLLMDEAKLVECPVINQEEIPTEKKGRMVRTREVVDYKTVETNNKVQQKVVSVNTTFTVKVPAPYNKELSIDARYVNIK